MNTSERSKTMNTSHRKRNCDLVLDSSCTYDSQQKRQKTGNEASVTRIPLPKDFHNEIYHSKFGSVDKDMKHVIAIREQILEGITFEGIEHGCPTHGSAPHNLKESWTSCTSASVCRDPFAPHLLEQVNYSKLGSDVEDVMGLISLIKAKRQHSAVYSPLKCKAMDFELSSTEDHMETKESNTTLVIISNGYNDDENDHKNAISEEQHLSPTQNYLTGQVIILDSSDDEAAELQMSINNYSLQDLKDTNVPQNHNWEGEYDILSGEGEFAVEEDVNVDNDRIAGDAEQSANEFKFKEGETAYVGEDETPALEVKITKDQTVDLDGISYGEKEHPANEIKNEKEKSAYFSKKGEKRKKEFDKNYIQTGVGDKPGLKKCSDEETYAEIEGEQGTKQTCDEETYAEIEGEQGIKQTCDEDYDADVINNEMADIWMEMGVAIEFLKDTLNLPSNESPLHNKDCDHILILKDDIGYVCRICGLIQQAIDNIIEYQFKKDTRSRTYWNEGRSNNAEKNVKIIDNFKSSPHDFSGNGIYPHPRHGKQMKPHQVEGFNFLIRNLMTETPGGCILAHAPGSGKTFMIISFLQSFMAKEPSARPLIVLPRGIISTWKHEFQRWQVESFPLYDTYSAKAESRSQQLEVLQQWVKTRSILFLGYKQFSSIVCDYNTDVVSTECQHILLTCPSILILDEGHTPRNNDTDVLMSLQKVQTPRKVVLSGTLFQNHVEEVFNVLNLVRPKFLKIDNSKAVKRRILSRVESLKNRNLLKNCSDKDFYDVVENTILKDKNFKRKVAVIQDLRDMTSGVLHYYKGDYLDELPGLVDFTVHLKLSKRQEKEVVELEKLGNRFKINSEGSVFYVHPQLKNRPRDSGGDDDEKIDQILETLDVNDGVKAKFFLNLLQLCESTGEKLLVFSQYVLPLKFLERLVMRVKNYSVGKEIFMITGDSDSDLREFSMDRFNTSADARVFFGSIKACGEGISLVGASRIIILDVHLNPSVSRQAIGRAFRPGQKRKVYVYRLIAQNSLEVENHKTCFKKESIAKLWFEWDEVYGDGDYELESLELENCGDIFLESPKLSEDVHSLFRR